MQDLTRRDQKTQHELEPLTSSDKHHLNDWQFLQEVPELDLPTDKPRPKQLSYDRRCFQSKLTPEIAQQVKSFENRYPFDTATFFLGIFHTLIYRYTAQTDFIIGVHDQNGHKVVPLHVHAEDKNAFIDHLTGIEKALHSAKSHGISFSRLQKMFAKLSTANRHPFFQVLFSFNGLSRKTRVKVVPLDVELVVSEVEGELRFDFDCSADLFELETVKRMALHFCRLVQDVVVLPTQTLDALTLLTDFEQHQLLNVWNHTVDNQYSKNFCELFEEQAKTNPNAIAVIFEETQLTYKELSQRSNQLAHFLLNSGVKSETIIGVTLRNSLNLIIAILGILKAGGVYLPLDPNYPAERLQFMLRDAYPQFLVTQSDVAFQLDRSQIKVIELDKQWSEIDFFTGKRPRK